MTGRSILEAGSFREESFVNYDVKLEGKDVILENKSDDEAYNAAIAKNVILPAYKKLTYNEKGFTLHYRNEKQASRIYQATLAEKV